MYKRYEKIVTDHASVTFSHLWEKSVIQYDKLSNFSTKDKKRIGKERKEQYASLVLSRDGQLRPFLAPAWLQI
jgi:hypothetical protein